MLTHFLFLPLLLLLTSSGPRLSQQAQDWSSELPPGKGREILSALCVSCHDLKKVIVQRRDRESWRQIVDGMLPFEQKQYLEEEMDALVNYLAQYLGPLTPSHENLQNNSELKVKYLNGEIRSLININTAPVGELVRLPGVNEEIAAMIVDYRAINGRFESSEDLKRIERIDIETFDRLKASITID